jgi:hypothetical protein
VTPPSIPGLRTLLAQHGHVVFRGPYNLTLGVLRASPGTLDRFDDLFYALHEDERGVWRLPTWACTADPGRPAVIAPRRASGVAILCTGQHRGAYEIGTHRGEYRCLVPTRPLPCWRDGNRDEVLDYAGKRFESSLLQIHRGAATADRPVGLWSAGCVAIVGHGLDEVVDLAEVNTARGWGSTYSLSVIDVTEEQLRRVV